jgi:uncharacterized alkaline shock family protein YloU
MTTLVDTEEGTVIIAPATLTRLVIRAAEAVEGVRVRRPRRGLDVVVADGRAQVSLELAARFGTVLPEIAALVQERVSAALESMCEVVVDGVDVTVAEVDF